MEGHLSIALLTVAYRRQKFSMCHCSAIRRFFYPYMALGWPSERRCYGCGAVHYRTIIVNDKGETGSRERCPSTCCGCRREA